MERETKLLFAGVLTAIALVGWCLLGMQHAIQQADVAVTALAETPHEAPAAPIASPPAESRILHLPDDGNYWHTTILLDDDWKRDRAQSEFLAGLYAEPRLRSLLIQTANHTYRPKEPGYRRYDPYRFAHPTIIVQDADGKVHYKCSGEDLAALSPGELADEIAASFIDAGRLFDRCPRPRPRPEPSPEPAPDPDDQADELDDAKPTVDDTRPVIDTPSAAFPWAILVVVVLLSGALAVMYHVRREARERE